MRKRNIYISVLLLLCLFGVQAVTSMRLKSATCDELAHHIPAGYVLLEKGDFQMDPSQPPLARYIAALPLKLFMDVRMPEDRSEWRREDRGSFGRDFFYKYNDSPERMLFYSRCSFVVVGLLCGIVLFLAARAFYGERAGLFALFLYSLSPNMLAHTRLATTDMTAAAFILLSFFTFWLFIRRDSFPRLLLAGTCLGLAQLSKYSALLLYLVFLILVLLEFPSIPKSGRRRLFVRSMGIFLVSLFVIWAGYGFRADPILKDAMRVEEKLSIAHHIGEKAVPFWNEDLSSRLDDALLSAPFPMGPHVLGVLGVIRHGQQGHGIYFGFREDPKLRSYGHPLYFAAAFLIKTPIPLILFLFLGLFAVFRDRLGREGRFLVVTIAVFFLTASLSRLQLGLRHILPLYPLCFIVAGRGMDSLRGGFGKAVLYMGMTWYILTAVLIWPDYLSYFNEAVGGPRGGYRYLRDSNIDWGQDLPALAEYMEKNDIDKVKLMYFGTASPESHGIKHEAWTEEERVEPGSAVYAVSVHLIDRVKWAKDREPDARLGYSIYVYDLRENRDNSLF